MRTTVRLSALTFATLLALPTRAQTSGSPDRQPGPFPYAPPPGFYSGASGEAAIAQPQGPAVTEVPDGAPRSAELPAAEVAPNELYPSDAEAYAPAAAAEEGDLGADETIADGYDDGYDPDAYTEFQQTLAPYGSWVNDPSYGEVWFPAGAIVGADFLPYFTNGHWVLSEYGWTWVSDWGWGWAPFHYGRWLQIAQRGWCWVPGTTWGPAWVAWRSGGNYVGWVALPPRGVTLAAAAPQSGPRSPWRFAPAGSLGSARATGVPPSRLPGIFGRTTVVATDRLLTHGPYAVHVNAGPVRAGAVAPVRLASVAPRALPKSTILPRPGASLGGRPWTHPGPVATAMTSPSAGWRGHGRASEPLLSGRPSAGPSQRAFVTPSAGRGFVVGPERAFAPPAGPAVETVGARSAPSEWRASGAPAVHATEAVAPPPVATPRTFSTAPPSRYLQPAGSTPYGAPSRFAAHAAPSGAAYAPMPAHVEPSAPAPASAPVPVPAHVAPPPRPAAPTPAFSPAPPPRFPGAGGGAVGGAPHHFGGGPAFPGRR